MCLLEWGCSIKEGAVRKTITTTLSINFNVLCLLKQCFLIKCNIGPLYTAPDTWDTDVYYINTSEIPGELLCENMISSHVKITCYLHKRKDHRCYGYIINCTFLSKKIFKWNGLAFHWCLHNKIIEHYMAAWRGEFSLLVLKNISLIRCTDSWNTFSTLKEKFCISAGPCNILYICIHVYIKIPIISSWRSNINYLINKVTKETGFPCVPII